MISILVTKKKEEFVLVAYILYLITFKIQTKALLNLKSEVNTINQAFASQLDLKI